MGLLLDVRLLAAVAVVVALVAVVGARCPQWLLPGGAALSIVLARPSAVGERMPILGPAVLTVVAGACAVVALRHRTRDAGTTPWPFALFAVAWVWLAAHRLLNPLAEPNLATSTLTTLVPVMAFYFVARDPVLLQRTRTALVTLVVAVSGLVVVALALVAVVGPTASLLGEVPLGYAGSGSGSALYFPGALAYGIDPDALFPRMLGVGREPGMGAIFAGWAFFAMPESFPRARLWKTVLVLALLATQSTAGIGLFGVCVMFQAVLGRRTFSPTRAAAAVVVGAGAVYLAVVNPVFGLLSKADSAGNSFSARNQATLDGLDALVTHPFTTATTGSSINLFAAIAVDGAPWFFLAGAFLLAPVLRARRRDPLRYAALLVLLVMLTSQPLAGNAGVLLLAALTYYAVAPRADADGDRSALPARAVTSGAPA